MVEHIVGVFEATEAADVLEAFVTVRNANQLREAIGKADRPIVIENRSLERMFVAFLNVQKWWLLAAVVAYAISQGFQIKFRHTEWKADRTIEREIILTPLNRR